MALMDSLLNAAMSAIGNQNGEGGQQNAALGMLMELVQQSGGIGNLMAKLQQGGLGDALNSWISTQSSNQSVSGSDLQQALGGNAIEQVAAKFGLNGQQAGDLLAQYLPNLVDSATPEGKVQDADGNETSLYHQVWQAGVILLPVQSVGVMGDERTYERAVALRAVTSTDAMTADWAHLPYEFLGKVSNDIINKVKGVNRVTYDISSKPPSTIEWE
mgnify:CR=1 FL=1